MKNRPLEKRVYSSRSNISSPWNMVRAMASDIAAGNHLAKRITIRDIRAMYRQSALGILWAFIMPVANTLVWIFLNGSGLVTTGPTNIPYPIYVFTGSMIWAVFLESVQAPINKVTQNKSIIAKVNFPREALIVAGVYQSLFNSGIKALILIGTTAVLGYFGGWHLLLFLPALFSLVLAGTAVGLLLTPLGALYTDISKSIPLVMQFLMYSTPVVYALPGGNGLVARMIAWNPLTPLVMSARSWLTGYSTGFLPQFLWVTLGFLILLAVVLVIFRLAVPILVERMNA